MNRKILIVAGLAALSALLLWGAWMVGTEKHVSKNASGEIFVAKLVSSEKGPTLVIRCNEEQVQDAFSRFTDYIGEEGAIPVSLPGGPMLLAKADVEIPQDMQPIKRTTIEVLKRYSPGKVILIAHSDCLLYDAVAAWKDEKGILPVRQAQDLQKAKRMVSAWFPRVAVETYYARKDGDKLRFFRVP